jgi:3-hydroxybutyrate dehydrogenase
MFCEYYNTSNIAPPTFTFGRFLKRKVGIVTGSTSGIGLGIARALAKAGCNVVLNGFGDTAEIEATRKELARKHRVRVLYHGADMTKPSEIADLVESTVAKLGAVDILVNNAGIQFTAPIESFPPEKWDAIIATNLSSAFHTTRKALPSMKARNQGRIINIASVHGLVGSTEKIAYVAAKHGIVGATKVTALELAETLVTCNSICPGWVLTPLVEKQIADMAAKDGLSIADATTKLLAEKEPSKRFTTVEQVAGMVLFLVSDFASNLTGQSIAMDGAWTAH